MTSGFLGFFHFIHFYSRICQSVIKILDALDAQCVFLRILWWLETFVHA